MLPPVARAGGVRAGVSLEYGVARAGGVYVGVSLEYGVARAGGNLGEGRIRVWGTGRGIIRGWSNLTRGTYYCMGNWKGNLPLPQQHNNLPAIVSLLPLDSPSPLPLLLRRRHPD